MRRLSALMLLLLVVLFGTNPGYAQWTWQVNNDGTDLRLQSSENGVATFDMRLGAGGAISEFRNLRRGNLPLLAPSFQGESTDRVFQWTAWSDNIINDIGAPGYQFTDRFNLTQAGTQNNTFAPIIDVRNNIHANRIDVYSVPKDQWQTEQQSHIQSAFSSLTRYEMMDGGVIKVRRVMRVGEATVDGSSQPFDTLYLEAWSPFRQMGVFDAMTMGFDANGNPDPSRSYITGSPTFPRYQWWNVTNNTDGYAAVYRNGIHQLMTAVGLVFGTEQAQYFGYDGTNPHNDRFVFNSMVWNHSPTDQGVAMLPALYFDRDGMNNPVLAGSIIDQSYYLVPRDGLDDEFAGLLAQLSGELSAPALYHPDYEFDGELAAIVNRLNQNLTQPGIRTENLGGIVQTVPEPSSAALLMLMTMTLVTRRRRR